MEKPKIVAVAGATASGKTALAVWIAECFSGEVVSFDSMQVYRGMPVGTAQPTEEEQKGIPHHLIGIRDPAEPFSCADFCVLAKQVVPEILSRGKLPVLCGGTGLYLDTFLRGGLTEETEPDPLYRAELSRLAERDGAGAVWTLLHEVDPESAEGVHPNNLKRVIRALEIFRVTGKKKSEIDRASREQERAYDVRILGVRYDSRELLYERIDRRVETMLSSGLEEEIRRLDSAGVFKANATAAQAIGYKEMLPWIRGEMTREEAVAALKTATRRYAKRQITWFSANPEIRWIPADRDGKMRDPQEIFEDARAEIAAFLGY